MVDKNKDLILKKRDLDFIDKYCKDKKIVSCLGHKDFMRNVIAEYKRQDNNRLCVGAMKELLSLLDTRISSDQIEFLEVPIREFADKWVELLEDLE